MIKTKNITIRIWEFEVYGIGPTLSIGKIKDVLMYENETVTVEIPYSLGVDPKGYDFSLTATTESGLVTIKNVVVADNKIKFDITSTNSSDDLAKIKINLINNLWKKSTSFNIRVQGPVANIAPQCDIAISGIYGTFPFGNKKENLVDGNYETYWSPNYSGGKWAVFDAKSLIDISTIIVYRKNRHLGSFYKDDLTINVLTSSDSITWATDTVFKATINTYKHILNLKNNNKNKVCEI